MDLGEWPEFLARWSGEWIDAADDDDRAELPAGAVERRWLGFDGASEEQLAAAERRLGCELPPSYRGFLAVTNGWLHAGPFIYRLAGTESVGWVRDLQPWWCDTELDDDRDVFVRSLCISTEGDAGFFLLDPGNVGADGEWAAHHVASWVPGLGRDIASFRVLMEGEYASFHALDHPENATSRLLDRQCEDARDAMLSGEFEAHLPLVEQAMAFGRVGAMIMLTQIDALLGRHGERALYSEEAAWLLDDPVLGAYAVLLPLVGEGVRNRSVVPGHPLALPWAARRKPRRTAVVVVDNLFGRSSAVPGWAESMAAAFDDGSYAPTFRGAGFDDAVVAARRLAVEGREEDAWQAVLGSLGRWEPSGPYDVAPALLVADSVLGSLITPERGHQILTTARGRNAE